MNSIEYFYSLNIIQIIFMIININDSHDHTVTGINGFKKLVNSNTFIDKSKFIEEFITNSFHVMLITRPRGFGKSTNLEMLKTFLEIEVDEYGNLLETKNNEKYFTNLTISKEKRILEYQGKYPVIYLSFKNVKGSTCKEIEKEMELSIRKSYIEYKYLLQANDSYNNEIEYLKEEYFSGNKISFQGIYNCLKYLSKHLHTYYGKHSFIFIDDFDKPIYEAYIMSNCTESEKRSITDTVIGILLAACKINYNVEKCLICGITQMAKAAVNMNFNNYVTYSILDSKFSLSFGFTEKEVINLLIKQKKGYLQKEINQWCGGYHFSDTLELCNPWLVMKYLENENNKLDGSSIFTDDLIILKKVFDSCDDFQKMEKVLYLLKNRPEKMSHLNNPFFHLDELREKKLCDIIDEITLNFGFLSFSENEDFVHIPNIQIQNIFEKLLKSWISQQTCILDEEMMKTSDVIFEALDRKNFTELISRLDLFFSNLFKRIKDSKRLSFEVNKELWLDGCLYLFMLNSKYCKNFEMFRKNNIESETEPDVAADLTLIPLKGKGSETYILNFKVIESIKNMSEFNRSVLDKTNNKYKILDKEFPHHIKTLCHVSILFDVSISKIQILYKIINL